MTHVYAVLDGKVYWNKVVRLSVGGMLTSLFDILSDISKIYSRRLFFLFFLLDNFLSLWFDLIFSFNQRGCFDKILV